MGNRQAGWHIYGTPEAVREAIPAFDQPIQNAPWLVIVFSDDRAFVFDREALVEMMAAGITVLGTIVRNIEKVPPE